MVIYTLTDVGNSIASHPTPKPSTAMRILYHLRRNGWSSSDERIMAQFGLTKRDLNDVVGKLVANQAITVKGVQ